MSGRAGTTVFFVIAIGAVIAAVVGGLIALPTPREERTRLQDERRAEDLRTITRAIDLYWTRHGRLPSSTEQLPGESGMRVSTSDPVTAENYEFRALGAARYELCANFEHESADRRPSATADRGVSEDFWSHGDGRWCFQLEPQQVPARETRLP